MSSQGQSIYSTPTFELFRRALTTQTIQQFHGINVYSTLPLLGPDWAQDCLNVVVSGSGGLSKMRLPVKLSQAIGGQNIGPNSFWDFQQGNGTRQTLASFGAALYYFQNDLALATLIENNALNANPWSFSIASNILWGANSNRMMKWTGANWWTWGIVAPALGPGIVPSIAGTLSPSNGGYFYWFSWKNSVTNSAGNISSPSTVTGNIANKAFQPTAAAPPDPQVDTVVWWRSLDGGGDPYRLCEVNINTGVITAPNSQTAVTVVGGTGNLQISDNTPDAALDQATRGPLINNPPLQGRYVATGQGRLFVFNLIGSAQDVIYSGYEQILFGRPEECFPPNNRLRLSIGAEQIAGGGVLQAGVVAFSQTGRMYMLRGQVEDISLNVPVNFTQYLEELPWTLGCSSHFSVMATPYGLIWLAGDKTVMLFDGRNKPYDISQALYPYLSKITPGTEAQAVAGYFNWIERDWYVLMCAVNGSLSLNRLFLFAFNTPPGSDQPNSVEAFVSDIPAQLGGATWVGLINTSKLQRMLCVAAQGFIQQLPVSSDTVGGITTDFTINPATNGNLSAYWRGGYFGNDSPQRSKMFRFSRLVTDQDPKAFQQTIRLVDDKQFPFTAPRILGPLAMADSRLGINQRAKRCSIEINFSQADAPANILELQLASVATADR